MLASASTHHRAITVPTSLTISSRSILILESARARSIAANRAWPSGVSGSSSANAKRSLDRVRPLLHAVSAERCAIVASGGCQKRGSLSAGLDGYSGVRTAFVSFKSWPRLVTTGVTTPYIYVFNPRTKSSHARTYEYRINSLVRRQRLNNTRNRLQNLSFLARLHHQSTREPPLPLKRTIAEGSPES